MPQILPLIALLWAALPQDAVQRPELDAPIAIRGATVVAAPAHTLDNATVVIENGRITAVAPDAPIPAAARELAADGMVVYAGLIDAFSRAGVGEGRTTAEEERRVEDRFESASEGPRARSDAANRNGVFARRRVEDLIDPQPSTFAASRNAGFGVAIVAPPRGVLGGGAAALSLGDRPLRRSVLVGAFAQTASFTPPPPRSLAARDRYPTTAFGVMAHFRQTLLDAQWYGQMREYVARHADARADLPYDRDLEVLQDVLAGRTPVMWEADGVDEIHRALDLAEEFGFRLILVGGREASRAAERIKRADVPVILTLTVPRRPSEPPFDPHRWRREGAEQSRIGRSSILPPNWERRPFLPPAAFEAASQLRSEELRNAAALEQAGVRWCVSTLDLSRPADAWPILREMIETGLPPDAALRALTTTPAELLGIRAELGTIEPGKRGTVTVLTKPLADKDAQVRWTIIDGQVFEPDPSAERSARGSAAPGRRPGGRRQRPADPPTADVRPSPDNPAEPRDDESSAEETASQPASSSAPTASAPATPFEELLAHHPAWPIETDKDRIPTIRTGGSVLLKNARVLPVRGDSQDGASILIEGGKIRAIGRDLAAPAGVQTIDLAGCSVMPGIIDPHSHIALDSVNEFSLSVVPEVRCADVVDSDSVQIFRALAGGVTTIHAMHGSANTIGGQCVVMKLKYGRPAREMIVHDAPRTVKFATGENVKRSGMPQRERPAGPDRAPERIRRFPGSRMGVEAVMRRSLETGRDYDQQRTAYEQARSAGRDVPPLRRDLRAEALADIVRGDIWINCHCYRADEILRLLAVAEDFGIRIATLHHCLEAYRIMPEIARHGCGTATFSDWWAYKVEAYDAVPHNAGMLARYGINATLKSDSADLMRHMTVEAAKTVRFSGLDEREALATITLNAARLFGMDNRIGTIEVGKDADLAVFNGHPLDTFARCVLTLIDGEVYFQHRDFMPSGPTPTSPDATFDADAAANAAQARGDGAGREAASGAAVAHHEATSGTNGSNGWSGTSRTGAIAIRGATIHPISAAPIPGGTLVMNDGRIVSVAVDAPIPPGATVIDATGLHVWPGIVNAASSIGLHEIDAVDVSIDTSETGLYVPDIAATSALNPQSAMIEVARAEGITTVLLTPSGSRIAGQAGLVNLDGWTAAEMIDDPRLGLVVSIPSRSPEPILDRRQTPDRDREFEEMRARERDEEQASRELLELERFFQDAQLYAKRPAGSAATDPRFEAMIPYVKGEKPVLFNAATYKGILEALAFADRLGLRPIILGGRDAWKIADVLAARNVPVVYDAVFALPSAVEGVRGAADEWDANYRAASRLAAAGVRFCFANRDSQLAKNVVTEAGFAVAHGLSPEVAARALTLTPAEILGVADRYGSLEPGKIANVVVTTGHLCQTTSVVRHVFIRGRPIPLDSKHTRDAERFAARPAADLPPARTDLRGPASMTTR